MILRKQTLPLAAFCSIALASLAATSSFCQTADSLTLRRVIGMFPILEKRQLDFQASVGVRGDNVLGWAWDLSAITGGVIAYPEIGWGWSPNSASYWNGAVTLHKISEGKRYTLDFNIRRTDRSGTWNTAFDIWIYPTGNPGSTAGGYELMIWLDHVNQGPWGSNPQTVSLAGHTWTAYNNDGSAGWKVLTYINAGNPINDARGFDLTAFFNDIVSRYGVPGSDYINAIEFGSETCGGSGMVEVANYALSVQ